MFKRSLFVIFLLLNVALAQELKDANLIKNREYDKISFLSLKKKNHCDKKKYLKYASNLTKEEISIYEILDRILRSNNLQSKNWRIGFVIDKETINAISLNNNLILINSSLYDCLHQNKDALAYAVAHELAHFILSHQKQTIENTYKIKKIEENIEKLTNIKQGEKYSSNLKNLINNIYLNQRNLEFEADNLALELIIRANYDYNQAKEIFEYFSEDYAYLENRNIYPLIYERLENLENEYSLLDINSLQKEGENNLFSSQVLTVQKSIDKETLIVNKPKNYKDYSFKITPEYEKYNNKGYFHYKNKDFNNAIKCFEKANQLKSDDFISLLYLSYSYEATGNIKQAKKTIKKAKALNPKEENILKQYKVFYKR